MRARKKAALALQRYVDNIGGSDYREPLPGEMRSKLEPSVMYHADNLCKKANPLTWLRPSILGFAVVLLICLFAIQPVRAGIRGAIVELFDSLRGKSAPMTYTLNIPGAELLSSEKGDNFTYMVYDIEGRRVAFVGEMDNTPDHVWADRQGEPFIVDQLRFAPYEAMCYEDEDGFYAIIAKDSHRLTIMMEGGDRQLFTDVLRAIIKSD